MSKGFFDGLIEDFCKHLEMQGAIEASKDENGKIDAAKAAGIAMGLGNTSLEDMALMGAMLGAEGAFDDDPSVDVLSDNTLIDNDDSLDIESTTEEISDLYLTPFEDTLVGINIISAEDMELLSDAGYDEFDLELMSSEELKNAMLDAGVDTDFYDFD